MIITNSNQSLLSKKQTRKQTARYKLLVSLLVFSFSFKACAKVGDFHLKIETPVVTKDLGKQTRAKGLSLKNTAMTGSVPSLGGGYTVSELFEVELMYGMQKYSLTAYGIDRSFVPSGPITCSMNPKYRSEVFAGAWRGTTTRDKGCSDDTFYSRNEMCVGATPISNQAAFATSNISAKHISGGIHTLVASGRVKPFKQVSIFSPYVSLGVGIAHNRSNYSESYYTSGSLTRSTKGSMRTNAIALEYGIGTEISLADNVRLDMAARYFDYGNHAIAPGISRKFNGYKLVAGAIYELPVKNRSPVVPTVPHSSMANEESKANIHSIRVKALAEGERNAAITIAKKMLASGMNKSSIATLTGISLTELDRIG